MRIDIEKRKKTAALKEQRLIVGKKKTSLWMFVFLLSSFFFSLNGYAQCAMCRAAIETEGNTAKAEAVNDGIVYLMIIPYVLVGAIGFAIYKMRQNKVI
jgi:hypothetical protein